MVEDFLLNESTKSYVYGHFDAKSFSTIVPMKTDIE